MTGPGGAWEFADVWILASIGRYGRRCSLADVAAAAERINQSMPRSEEVESGLAKLAGAGLARIFDDWTCELTDEGATVWPGGVELSAHLEATLELLSGFEAVPVPVRLPAGAWDRAVAEYHQTW